MWLSRANSAKRIGASFKTKLRVELSALKLFESCVALYMLVIITQADKRKPHKSRALNIYTLIHSMAGAKPPLTPSLPQPDDAAFAAQPKLCGNKK